MKAFHVIRVTDDKLVTVWGLTEMHACSVAFPTPPEKCWTLVQTEDAETLVREVNGSPIIHGFCLIDD